MRPCLLILACCVLVPATFIVSPAYAQQNTSSSQVSNDNTVEGFRHRSLPVFSVQYHPEASPGPHDAAYLFDAFIDMMKTGKPPTGKRLADLQAMRETTAPK